MHGAVETPPALWTLFPAAFHFLTRSSFIVRERMVDVGGGCDIPREITPTLVCGVTDHRTFTATSGRSCLAGNRLSRIGM